MTEKDPLPLISGADRYLIRKMVDHSLEGVYDHFRMLSFWRRLLAGDNDPEEIAQGLAMALMYGRYIRAPDPGRGTVIHINISGSVDPHTLSDALKGALGGGLAVKQ